MSDETAPVTTAADQTISATNEEVDTPSTHVPAVGGVNVEGHVKDETTGKKVFIGNLAYATTEEEVREFISPAQGNVIEVNLPTRFNSKPAGYAFVLYETEEQANNAVEKLNTQVLHEREISVAIAKPPAPKKPRNKRGPKTATEGTGETGTTGDEQHAVTEGEGGDGQATKSKKKKAKRPARRLPEEGEDAESHAAGTNGDAAEATDGAAKKPKAKRNRKPKSAQNGEHAVEGAGEARIDDDGNTEHAGRPRSARAPRQKTTLGDPSKTLLFVANLPFSVDDAALTEAFTSLSITPKSSKIITKPSYHYVDGKRERGPRRSKGFAFVEVENEQAQQQAIEKLQGFKMGDREITIKVANERMHEAEEHGDESALKQEGEKQAVVEEQKQEA